MKSWYKILLFTVISSIIFWVGAFLAAHYGNVTITANNVILTFVGILATFIVISNYAQVNKIEDNFNTKVKEIEDEFKAKIKELEEKYDTKTKEINTLQKQIIAERKYWQSVNFYFPQDEEKLNQLIRKWDEAVKIAKEDAPKLKMEPLDWFDKFIVTAVYTDGTKDEKILYEKVKEKKKEINYVTLYHNYPRLIQEGSETILNSFRKSLEEENTRPEKIF